MSVENPSWCPVGKTYLYLDPVSSPSDLDTVFNGVNYSYWTTGGDYLYSSYIDLITKSIPRVPGRILELRMKVKGSYFRFTLKDTGVGASYGQVTGLEVDAEFDPYPQYKYYIRTLTGTNNVPTTQQQHAFWSKHRDDPKFSIWCDVTARIEIGSDSKPIVSIGISGPGITDGELTFTKTGFLGTSIYISAVFNGDDPDGARIYKIYEVGDGLESTCAGVPIVGWSGSASPESGIAPHEVQFSATPVYGEDS